MQTWGAAMASPAEPRHPGGLQICAGIGWVNFDRASRVAEAVAHVDDQAPAVRCMGKRDFKTWEPAAEAGSRAAQSGAARSSGATLAARGNGHERDPAPFDGGPFVKVADQTRALVCAGQLSMLVSAHVASSGGRAAAAAAVAGASPDMATAGEARQAAFREPYQIRCEGISFRFEKVVANAEQPAQEAKVKAGDVAILANRENSGELEGTLLRSLQAVAGRIGRMASSVRGATVDGAGPWLIASETPAAAKRICVQAGKIARRSAEKVSRLAPLPWHEDSGRGGDDKPKTSGGGGT